MLKKWEEINVTIITILDVKDNFLSSESFKLKANISIKGKDALVNS